MIKLKIGDNFLITTHKDRDIDKFIPYMMGCFHLHNKIALGIDLQGHTGGFEEYIDFVVKDPCTELYILLSVDWNSIDSYSRNTFKSVIKDIMLYLKNKKPGCRVHIIKMTGGMITREYKLAKQIYTSLRSDKDSILYNLSHLDEYKHFQTRYKAIPGELRVINDSLKQMSKVKKVSDRLVTLKDIEYLNLIDTAELAGSDLIINIKPQKIFCSEPLGLCFSKNDFNNNPYLFKATSYLYQGYTFGMVGTRVAIHSDFRPEFIETLDHQWDDMMERNNWSSVGYMHFGKGHLCGGEFNDVMAHTSEHGLEYYFICFKQYITTANIRDYAGKKVWWYPIYDNEGKMVYCAALDILRDALLKGGLDSETKEKVKNMSWEEFQAWRLKKGLSFRRLDTRYISENVSSYSGKTDVFLEVCQEKDPELYKKITKGAK